MARRDPMGIRLLTRRGNDWSSRFPLIVEAVNHLRVRSCLIDGEVVCCDMRGVAAFHMLRRSICWSWTVPKCGGSPSRFARRHSLASCAKAGMGCASMSTLSTLGR
jgi:hypothetical protein